MPLTEEQQAVVASVRLGRNVVCISKPGTGKTTTALECARVAGRTLLLTYNRKLKEESRTRVVDMGLETQVVVHSYHAAAAGLFELPHQDSVDDSLIHAALSAAPKAPLNFDLLVIDEAQDMTPLYADFVQHLLSHLVAPPQMLLIGDPFQRIFAYLGASWNFMMQPEQHFGDAVRGGGFEEHHLTICWRITPEMAEWVNTNLDPRNLGLAHPEWWEQHGGALGRWWAGGIRSGKPSSPGSVLVIPYESRALHTTLAKTLPRFHAGECAFLCKSVSRPNDLIASAVETFAGSDWLVTNDTSAWDPAERLTNGKTVVTTITKFKGLERKFVCVVGLDAKWEFMQNDPLDLFTSYFVAATRASECLVIVTGDVPYATIRRAPLPPQGSRYKTTPEAATLLQHTPFAELLNVPWSDTHPEGAVRAVEIGRCGTPVDLEDIDAARYVPGRGAFEEDAGPFLDDAVVAGVAARLGLSLSLRAQRLARTRVPPSVRTWLAQARSEWSADDTFRLAVAKRAAESQYSHQWRQVHAHAPLLDVLAKCVDNGHALLDEVKRRCTVLRVAHCDPWRVEVNWDWFCEAYDGAIETRGSAPHFVGDGVAVWVFTAPALRQDKVLLSAFVAALRTIHLKRDVRAFLLHANEGILYEIESRLEPWELVGEVLKCRLRR